MNITADELYDLLIEDLGIDEETLNRLIRHNAVVPTDRTGLTDLSGPNNTEEE